MTSRSKASCDCSLHLSVERVVASESRERRRHGLPEIVLVLRPPELFAIASIKIAQRLSHNGVRALLSQFRLQRFHKRNEDLRLDLGLLKDGNAHGSPCDFASGQREPRSAPTLSAHRIEFVVGSDRERVGEPVGHGEHGGDRGDVPGVVVREAVAFSSS